MTAETAIEIIRLDAMIEQTVKLIGVLRRNDVATTALEKDLEKLKKQKQYEWANRYS